MRSTWNETNYWEINHYLKDIISITVFLLLYVHGLRTWRTSCPRCRSWNHSFPPAGRCGEGRRDFWAGKGVLSAVRLGRVIPRGGSSGSKKGKPTFFSLLRTRWNVMVWSPTSQGGGYPRGKNRRKRVKEGSGVKTQPRRASSSPVVSDCGWTSASVSPVAPHELKPGKLWIYPGVISLTGQQKSWGKVWISVYAPVLGRVWGD